MSKVPEFTCLCIERLCLTVIESLVLLSLIRVCVHCFVELETKRILLEIFKEKQQKSQQAGTIPSFYKKACPLLCIK